MLDVDPFEQHVRTGLELAGVPVEDLDVQIMRLADAVYGPELRALQAANLREVTPEPVLDPSRAPEPA